MVGATDMHKNTGDITCIDGAALGNVYWSCNGTHSGGSGDGYHADGEDKDFILRISILKIYGYCNFIDVHSQC